MVRKTIKVSNSKLAQDQSRALGQKIRRARIDAGLSMAELAQLSGLGSKSAMSRVELGLVVPTAPTLRNIAATARVSEQYLLREGCLQHIRSSDLTPEEVDLVTWYRSLDDAQRHVVIEFSMLFH